MTQIAVLTPDPSDRTYIGRWPEVLERLKATLESTGATVSPTPWTDHVEDASGLAAYDLILPVIAWGCCTQPEGMELSTGADTGAAQPANSAQARAARLRPCGARRMRQTRGWA